MTSPEHVIPYATTAIDIASAKKDEIDNFTRSVFPEATDSQLEKLTWFAAGLIHEGLVCGLELSSHEPLACFDAYKLGFSHGLEERKL